MREVVGESKNPVMLHAVGKAPAPSTAGLGRPFPGGNCSLEVSKERDHDGLCWKALRGGIKEFITVSRPYEEPQLLEMIIETHLKGVKDDILYIMEKLKAGNITDPLTFALLQPVSNADR